VDYWTLISFLLIACTITVSLSGTMYTYLHVILYMATGDMMMYLYCEPFAEEAPVGESTRRDNISMALSCPGSVYGCVCGGIRWAVTGVRETGSKGIIR
jgi:hypothetical protein